MALTQAFLRIDTGRFQCDDCHQFYLNPVVYGPLHRKVCRGRKHPDLESFFCLDMLGNGNYVCHMGCNISESHIGPLAIAKHFVDYHRQDELDRWHIKRENLLAILGSHGQMQQHISSNAEMNAQVQ